VASIEEVKHGLAQAADEADEAITQARAAADAAGRMIERLTSVAQGTSHPKIQEATSRAQQCRQQLAQAATLAQQGAQAAREYYAILG
jgi:hypothetical protein